MRVKSYLTVLEEMFGPRDKRFVFGTVGLTTDEKDRPQTYFPNGFHFLGKCTVDVHITSCPWKNLHQDQGGWQVAHESVHLLDPGPEGANFLEEGLATWFQDESEFHNEGRTTLHSKSQSGTHCLVREGEGFGAGCNAPRTAFCRPREFAHLPSGFETSRQTCFDRIYRG